MIEAEESAAEISGLKIEDKDLSIIQKGHIRKLIHLCRLIAGTEATFDSQKEMEDRLNKAVNDVTKLADETTTFTATHSAQPSGPQVPLKHVVSQGSEETVPKISNEDMTKHWDQFKLVYGRDPRPEEECTADQLTGVDTLLKRDCAPYVDFGVWGPNHHRLLKKLRNTGLQLHVGGVLRNVETSGPPDAHSWSECYNLLSTALVGFRAVGLGPMLDYSRLILGYASRYGTLAWPLQNQCDVRCRLEHMERLRSVLERNYAMALSRGQAPAIPFDPSRPWDSVWSAAVDDHAFWHRQFEEPALIILTKAGRLTDVVAGEAPIETKSGGGAEKYHQTEPDRKRRKTQKPRVEQKAKVHRESMVYTPITDEV